MSKKQASDEIDLIETLIVIWDRKWNVILFLLIFLVSTYIFQSIKNIDSNLKNVKVTSKIKPITVFDEAKYKIYNTFLNSIQPNYILRQKPKIFNNKDIIELLEEVNVDEISRNFKVSNNGMESLIINNINKKFLYDLFIDKLNQKTYLIKKIKKSNFIKRDNYLSKLDYEDAIFQTVSSIRLLNIDESKLVNKNFSAVIQFKTDDIEEWENFLKFIVKETNIEIQKGLSEMINSYLDNSEKLKKFVIEDIEAELLSAVSDQEKNDLIRFKKGILSEKFVERMKGAFASSPIANLDSFYAAKIDYDTSVYETEIDNSMKNKLLIAGVFGIVFGILFALIANAIKNRR